MGRKGIDKRFPAAHIYAAECGPQQHSREAEEQREGEMKENLPDSRQLRLTGKMGNQ